MLQNFSLADNIDTFSNLFERLLITRSITAMVGIPCEAVYGVGD